jgi:hypothetical protein
VSSFVYNQARTDFATAQINWTTADIRVALTGGNYAPSVDDLTLADVGAGNLIVRDIIMATKNVTNGICSGTIPPFNAFIEPAPVIGVLIYILGGSDASSRVIYYSDDGIGFPFTPQGFNYLVAFDQTSGGFFEV